MVHRCPLCALRKDLLKGHQIQEGRRDVDADVGLEEDGHPLVGEGGREGGREEGREGRE
jgi:hypothetical protein